MSLFIEARMLLKIKAVRRDLRKFSGPARFLIVLNLKKLLGLAPSGERACHFSYVQSRNLIENK
jgi:hypothetical protein